ncbi:hypothetical protein JCM19379_13370 [Methyloparacoccus murrellii]
MTTPQLPTPHRSPYFAWLLARRAAGDSVESLASTLVDSQVDRNPHQVEAARFACRNLLARGVILAGEVGPGKTIEAGLVISERWAERRRKVLASGTHATDELNAYKVFETLNARGVRLSATDLLKNYLFSVLDRGGESDHELHNLEERWESLVGRLPSENFPDFLRAHWNSRRNFARQADLFKTIRSKIIDREAVFGLLRGMEEDLDTYLALTSPEVSDWSPEDKHNAGVLKTFRVRQPYPLLLAARRSFDASDFSGLLRATVVISMRYNVIGAFGTAEQERTYNTVAERIAKGELQELSEALSAMRSIYVEDRVFRAAFAEKIIRTTDSRNNRVVRFILCALERQLSGNDHSFTRDAFNIEHILPQRAPDGWGGFSNEEMDGLLYRLGNMTLMQAGANRNAGNADYAAKRPGYQQSGFFLTQKVAVDNAEWTPERIAVRQNGMANQATAIWRIAQLS